MKTRLVMEAISELVDAKIALYSMGPGGERDITVLAAEIKLEDLLDGILHE